MFIPDKSGEHILIHRYHGLLNELGEVKEEILKRQEVDRPGCIITSSYSYGVFEEPCRPEHYRIKRTRSITVDGEALERFERSWGFVPFIQKTKTEQSVLYYRIKDMVFYSGGGTLLLGDSERNYKNPFVVCTDEEWNSFVSGRVPKHWWNSYYAPTTALVGST